MTKSDMLSKTAMLRVAAAALCIPVGVAILPTAAFAQFSEGYEFLKAVREQDGTEVNKFVNEPGTTIINTRDDGTGETGLHITVRDRSASWTLFLLQKGANPNIADRKGQTPLIVATQLNFVEGVEWLIKYQAQIDQANKSGETPLIIATQLRNADLVRILLKAGANPEKPDNIAGKSARDYATEDKRAASILSIIENHAKKSDEKKAGELDFSGFEPKKKEQ